MVMLQTNGVVGMNFFYIALFFLVFRGLKRFSSAFSTDDCLINLKAQICYVAVYSAVILEIFILFSAVVLIIVKWFSIR